FVPHGPSSGHWERSVHTLHLHFPSGWSPIEIAPSRTKEPLRVPPITQGAVRCPTAVIGVVRVTGVAPVSQPAPHLSTHSHPWGNSNSVAATRPCCGYRIGANLLRCETLLAKLLLDDETRGGPAGGRLTQ